MNKPTDEQLQNFVSDLQAKSTENVSMSRGALMDILYTVYQIGMDTGAQLAARANPPKAPKSPKHPPIGFNTDAE